MNRVHNEGSFANLYRPQKFSEVVGQDLVVSALKRIAASEGVSVRSIFIKGAYGSGKTTTSRIFAKALNCQSFKEEGDVCNECSFCRDVQMKTSNLYMELDASSVGNVEYIRDLSERLAIRPEGRRLVVIDEIHSASTQALNALLKLIEDGVPNTIFLFASTEDILPTIKSRSLCLEVSPIPAPLIESRVREIAKGRGIEITEESLSILSMKAQGHMRDALQLLQLYELVGVKGLDSSYGLFKSMVINALSNNPSNSPQELLRKVLEYSITDVKSSIGVFIRNLFTSKEGSVENKLYKAGVGRMMFGFFFTPTAQAAMRDEVGLEILLRAFLDKLKKG